MALDEATAAYLAEAEASQARELTFSGARRPSGSTSDLDAPAMARVQRRPIVSVGGSIPIRIYVPSEPVRAVIAFCHGGGWVDGGLDESETLVRHLAACTSCAVVSIGYRLAPGFRYPTAVQDAWAGLQWAACHLDEIAGARVPLLVAGEGAGGNLAAVVARRSCERTGPEIALQVLICPITDCDLDSLSYTDPANQLLRDREFMIRCWEQYAPDPSAREHPDASPLRAPFLSGLPPAVVVTAEHDVVRDDGELYALRLVQAGVRVDHRRFCGQIHGFISMIGILPQSVEGLRFIAAAIERSFRTSALTTESRA